MKLKQVSLNNPIIRSLTLLLFLCLTLLIIPMPVQADTGMDGDLTISTGTVVLNRYANISNINGNVITVGDINTLDDNAAGHYTNEDLSPGDLILIYQAQGAQFANTTDGPEYGAFNYQNAGHYEFAVVDAVSGNDITIDESNTPPYACNGLSNTYDPVSGNVQIVRIPQYTNLTIENGATINAEPWNGQFGGIVAIHVQHNFLVNGTVDVSGLSFRGGDPNNSYGWGVTTYRGTNLSVGGEKGESILGDQTIYDGLNGRYGRGAPANGGGGGDAHNSGGGGGANGFSGSGTWDSGHGYVASDDIYAAAWDLDDGNNDPADSVPAYFQGGAGGGRGGYSFSNDATVDPNISGPGDLDWDGDDRRQVGGLGGRPLNNDPNARLFFGGGGGAGDGNNSAASPGANGGGLVILIAKNTSGNGSILSNGENAGPTNLPLYDDGAGGGGAGGTVILKTTNLAPGTLTVSANGGAGGDQLEVPGFPAEAMGPGGGGGGGYIAVASANGSLLSSSVSGGNNGVTLSPALSQFPPNGATRGYPGGTNLTFNNPNAFSFPGCQTPTAISLQAFTAYSDTGGLLANTFIVIFVVILALITWVGLHKKTKSHYH